ncbi:MAG: RtcB family protein, partial [Candidatus Electrothrix sp. ATG2]|nr:RtcB family protein [Candidatus Electrothrix sp. ATG2]
CLGVVIGCGMCAVKTSVQEIERDALKKIMGDIRKKIPVGFKHHKKAQDESLMPESGSDGLDGLKIVQGEYQSALKQLGTLGGGNHFVEIQQGSDGFLWLMIHSGSRNLGYKVAHHYNKLAVTLNRKWHTSVPEKWQLAFLPLDGRKGQDYLQEMQYCVDFALANRRLMMERMQESFVEVVSDVRFEDMINIAHNYAAMENHFKKNVMIHRKGATRAYVDQLGIIPGSQGTASYIVQGRGEPEAFFALPGDPSRQPVSFLDIAKVHGGEKLASL